MIYFRLASLAPPPAAIPAHPSAKANFRNGGHCLCCSTLIDSILYMFVWLVWHCPPARPPPSVRQPNRIFNNGGRCLCF